MDELNELNKMNVLKESEITFQAPKNTWWSQEYLNNKV